MKVLIIDDSPADREAFLRLLRAEGPRPLDVRGASDLAEAFEMLGNYEPDCVFLDRQLPDGDVFEFLRAVSLEGGSMPFPVVLLIGETEDDVAMRAIQAGAHDYLEKGHVEGPTLARVLRHALDRHRLLEELRGARDRAHHLATHCPLTSLPNRHLLQDRLAGEIARARRTFGTFGVLLIDIDRLMVINDTLGQSAGDTVLTVIAERIGAVTRETDTVARVGGDEFAVVLSDLARSIDGGRVAAKMLAALSAPIQVEAIEVRVSASLGIALFPNDGDTAAALLGSADVAMYRAKEDGGGTYHYYRKDMNRSSAKKLSLERDLRNALERGELTLHFQPIVDGRDGRVTGAEALARWTHPQHGPVPPGDFIPLAEETGLIVELGQWVLREACERAREWQEAGLRAVPVSVNVSVCQLSRKNFVDLVSSVLLETGLEGRYLELEVTESCFMRDVTRISETLAEVRRLGVRVAVDDFGTGFSSLHMLKRLPVDCLKIDRVFVEEASGSVGEATIATAIIALAKSLSLSPVAEGVERSEQLEFLLENGCYQTQGFLFSAPLPDEDFRRVLRAGKIQAKEVPDG